jgi:hypothetical protein
MTLAPGAERNESSANEHAWAEQWLYVVSTAAPARIAGPLSRSRPARSCKSRRASHTSRSRLVTVDVYVPPAYGSDGEPLRKR